MKPSGKRHRGSSVISFDDEVCVADLVGTRQYVDADCDSSSLCEACVFNQINFFLSTY